eukprot:TRINITY_DN4007_c0_g2_i1.p1 TRINITY_DN4007_c0_g2~~TRINITY_DN4007_c0_g2_i1.p1  ORF type:complete len:246 (-),score=64.34 TRINITY_DN4007_c0_g2_i1:283-1020(-)
MPKKDTITSTIDITIKTVYNLPDDVDSKEIALFWKRGKKKENNGKTDTTPVKSGVAVFGAELHFDVTLLRDIKKKKFDSKKIEFDLKEISDNKKKSTITTLGSLDFDLSTYGEAGKFEAVIFPFSYKKKLPKDAKKPSIKLDIVTKWTHLNKKKLIEGSNAKEKISVGGIEYGLETDSNFVTEDDVTGMSDMSSVSEIEDTDEDDKDEDQPKSTPNSARKSDSKSKKSSDKKIQQKIIIQIFSIR